MKTYIEQIYKKGLYLLNKHKLLLLLIYLFLLLSPSLKGGYYSDDLIAANEHAHIQLDHISFPQYFYKGQVNSFLNGNRLTFVSPSTILIYYSSNIYVYKSGVLFLMIFNILLFGILIWKLTHSKQLSYLAMVVVPILFQFRFYHDPILSNYGFLQYLFFYISSSILLLFPYTEKGGKLYLIASVLCYNYLLYSYEIGVLLIIPILFGIVYIIKGYGSKFKVSIPYFFSVSAYLYLYKVLTQSTNKVGLYSGTAPNFNIYLIFRTFIYQISAAFPLSYYLSKDSVIFCRSLNCVINNLTLPLVATIILFNLLLILVLRRNKYVYRNNLSPLIGLCLVILPAIMISLSKKYQLELNFGIGYTVVYIQYFGVVMLFISLYSLNYDKRPIKLMLVGLLNIILILTFQANNLVIKKSNIDLYERRNILADAIGSKGLLKDVPNGSDLLIIDKYNYDPYNFYTQLKGWAYIYHWKNNYFVYEYSNKILNVYDSPDTYFSSNNNGRYLLIFYSAFQDEKTNVYKVISYKRLLDGYDIEVASVLNNNLNNGISSSIFVSNQTRY